jgi:hypothetical protein
VFNEFNIEFARYGVRTEDRLLIHSVCTKCGASKLVSYHDGSLEKWEDSHKCEERPAAA